MFWVNIDVEGNVGELIRIYKIGFFYFMDDFIFSGDILVVMEFLLINGLVKNYIILLDIGSNYFIKKIVSDCI